MDTTLSIRVKFVTGRYHGEEWPPSPMKLFQALVAGAGKGMLNLPDHVGRALRWLEQQESPIIIAPSAPIASSHVSMVPNNDDDKTMSAYSSGKPSVQVANERKKRYTDKLMRCRFAEEGVTYLWSVSDNDRPLAEDVAQIANELFRLGRGIDAAWAVGVVGETTLLDENLQIWHPVSGHVGQVVIRTPVPGSLVSLQARQQARLSRIKDRNFVDPPVAYMETPYATEKGEEVRPYSLYRLHALDGKSRFSWRQDDIITMGAMVRHALIRNSPTELASFVSGHPDDENMKNQRLSWVPLPSVGHNQADGRIRRVMILSPRNESWERHEEAVFGVRLASIEREGKEVALIQEVFEADGAIAPYFCESREWYSVTPVILPGFTSTGRCQSGKVVPKKIANLVQKAFRREGYPEIEEVWTQKAPFHPAGLVVSQYKTARYMNYAKLHVRVRFIKPVRGPVLVGVGRHYGLGLFAAD